MNKAEMIDHLSEKCGTTKTLAETFLTNFAEAVKTEVSAGRAVKLKGLGTFLKATRAARNGIDPRNKNPIKIPSKSMPKFRAGDEFRNLVK